MNTSKIIRELPDEELFGIPAEELAARFGCSKQTVFNVRCVERKHGRGPKVMRAESNTVSKNRMDRIRAVYAHPVDVAFLETLGRGDA